MELLEREMQKEKITKVSVNTKPLPKNKIIDDNG